MKGIDGIGKQVLDALLDDPRADAATLGARLGLGADVVQARLDRMQQSGFVSGFTVRLDSDRLGMPHEVLVTATPTDQTTRDRLDGLCHSAGVTRVWTLANRASVAFTLRGSDPDRVREHALVLAVGAGLAEPTVTLIVDTLHDEPSRGVHTAWSAAR